MITKKEVSKSLLVLNIIWAAILVSLAIYLFIGHIIAADLQTSMDVQTYTIIKFVFFILAFVILISTRFVKKFFLSSAKVQTEQTSSLNQNPILQKYTVAMIITWALSETIGIFGLILFLLGKSSMDFYILIMISAVAMFINRPNKEEVINLSRNNLTGTNTSGGAV